MREDFEVWAESRSQPLLRQGEGYAAERTGLTWKAWKASRDDAAEKIRSLGLAPRVLAEVLCAMGVEPC